MPGASGPPVSRAMRPRSASSCFGSARVIVFSSSSESRKLRPRNASACSKWPCSISVLIAWLLATISVSGVALGALWIRPIMTGVGSGPARYSTAASPSREARIRSNGVGEPPRCTWPSTVTRASRPERFFRISVIVSALIGRPSLWRAPSAKRMTSWRRPAARPR